MLDTEGWTIKTACMVMHKRWMLQGFPVFCSAPVSCNSLLGHMPLCEGESLAQCQMQVPGCAGGCCFRFLTAPDFSLYTIGIC